MGHHSVGLLFSRRFCGKPCVMWNKIYLTVLALSVAIMGFFTYYAWSWLKSVGDPRIAWESFNYDRRAGVYFLVASTIVLLLTSNAVLWTVRTAWALWATHFFFAVFAITLLIWLHLAGTTFCLENEVCQSPSRGIGPLLAVSGILGLGVIVFFDQFVILRLQEKMYGRSEVNGEEKENSRPDAAES